MLDLCLLFGFYAALYCFQRLCRLRRSHQQRNELILAMARTLMSAQSSTQFVPTSAFNHLCNFKGGKLWQTTETEIRV